MKRKIFSIFLALVLVLSFSLMTAVPAGAVDLYTGVVLVERGGATAEWSNAAPAGYNGDYTVKFTLPAVPTWDDMAIVEVWYGQALSTISNDDLSFTYYSEVGAPCPFPALYLDTDDDGVADWGLGGQKTAIQTAGEWVSTLPTDYWNGRAYDPETGLVSGPENWKTLAEHLAGYPTATIFYVALEYGGPPTANGVLYVDDITISGTIYTVEPIALVDDDFTSATPGWEVTHFLTIQDAIDAVETADGHTILVADGTYNENVVVNKSLTIKAASSPVIDGEGTLTNPAIHVSAADVTLEGFTIQNFIATGADQAGDIGAILVEGDNADILGNIVRNITCTGTAGDCPAGLGIDVSANYVEVIGNEVYDISSIGIRVRARFEDAEIEKTDILLEDNTVHDTGNSCVLVVGYVTGIEISGGNKIYDSLAPTPFSILMIPFSTHAPSNVLIEGNTIYNGYSNICLGGVTNVTITGNTIYGAIPHYSDPENIKGKNIYIREWGGFLTEDVTITSNNITGAEGSGVYIRYDGGDASSMASTTSINFNKISGNTEYGVLNQIDTSVDAEVNYWGDISGPTCEVGGYLNPGGTGNAVSDYVAYLPWLTRDSETVLADEIEYFGYPMVHLETGWNTFSTPIALDAGCNEWDEYVALGDGLAIHATSPAYAFDPTVTPPWVPLNGDNADYPLKPCDAIYVRMAEPDIAAILFSPDLSVPSKDLYAGWNLVGLAYMETVGYMDAGEALAMVLKVTGDLEGYELVVSPPVAGQQSSWFALPGGLSAKDMYITEGYWVSMKNPGTLVGFSFTPISLHLK